MYSVAVWWPAKLCQSSQAICGNLSHSNDPFCCRGGQKMEFDPVPDLRQQWSLFVASDSSVKDRIWSTNMESELVPYWYRNWSEQMGCQMPVLQNIVQNLAKTRNDGIWLPIMEFDRCKPHTPTSFHLRRRWMEFDNQWWNLTGSFSGTNNEEMKRTVVAGVHTPTNWYLTMEFDNQKWNMKTHDGIWLVSSVATMTKWRGPLLQAGSTVHTHPPANIWRWNLKTNNGIWKTHDGIWLVS